MSTRKLQILSNARLWKSKEEAIANLNEQLVTIRDRELISARYQVGADGEWKVIFGLGIVEGDTRAIAIIDGEAMPQEVEDVIEQIKAALDNKVDWSDGKTSIIGPTNFALTAMVNDSEGHVLLCQRNDPEDDFDGFVTELGNSVNKLTLNSAQKNIQVDFPGQGETKYYLAYQNDVDAANGELQSEIDNIEQGAGLNEDGTYSAKDDANYISGATSLKNADELLDEAVKNLNDSVTANKVIAGNGISVSEAASGTTVSALIDATDKILSTSANGILATLGLEYDERNHAILLKGKGGEVINKMDASAFIVDGMIESVTLEGSILTFKFNTESGKEEDIKVDLANYIKPYTAGNGIEIADNTQISVKKSASSEEFLQVLGDGIAVNGISQAIDDKIEAATPKTPDTIVTTVKYFSRDASTVKLNFAFSTKSGNTYTAAEDAARTIPAATATEAGVMTSADKAKFDNFFGSGTGTTGGALEYIQNQIDTIEEDITNIKANMLTEIEAGNGINVTAKDTNKQTVSIKLADSEATEGFLEVTAEGLKTKDEIIIDCGKY